MGWFAARVLVEVVTPGDDVLAPEDLAPDALLWAAGEVIQGFSPKAPTILAGQPKG